jgi:hypothetical protein
MLKISVPSPCHENWEAMTPQQQGRHCDVCSKTVVDFTAMTDEEVKQYFVNRAGEKLCGRFNNSQLQKVMIEVPNNIFELEMPFWKKFLAACLLAFSTMLFSCETHTTGKAVNAVDKINNPQKVCNTTMGLPMPVDTAMNLKPEKIDIKNITVQGTTVGEFSLPPLEDEIVPVDDVLTTADTSHKPIIKKDTTTNKTKEIKPVLKPDTHIKMGIVAMVPIKKDPPKTDPNICEGKTMY